jgi:pimeloyl-ACP methyl ester carboxylesterase
VRRQNSGTLASFGRATKIPSSVFKSGNAEAEALAAIDAAMALWPIPFEEVEIVTDYGDTHVTVSGAERGPPLVLLHCALMTSAIWSPIVQDLGARFRTFAVDVMGDFGRTVPARPPKSDAEFADWLGQTLNGLGLGDIHLMGWSFGGFVAANFAIQAPARVLRLALLAPFATFVRPGLGFLAGFVPLILPRPSTSSWFEGKLCARGSFGCPEHSEILFQRFKNGRVAFRSGPRVFKDEELKKLTMPSLLLVGEDEFLYSGSKAVHRANTVLPRGEAYLLARCNHAVVSDQTAEVVRRLDGFF